MGLAFTRLLVASVVLVACHAEPRPVEPVPAGAWIERSNANARLLLDVQARFQPEQAARTGVANVDDQIIDLAPGHRARERDAKIAAVAVLRERARSERDPQVKQDLAILIDAAELQVEGSGLYDRLIVPYYPLTRMIFMSIRGLLDAQVAVARQPAALVRVRKYAGLVAGATAVVQLAEAETRAGLASGLLPPSRAEVEHDLETAKSFLDGIDKLFAGHPIEGSTGPVAALRTQLEAYLEFVRTEVMPKARADFRLPPEIYAWRLRSVGVDIPVGELTQRAHTAFTAIQAEMQPLAARIAAARGFASSDYRDVIRELKKASIPDDQVLAFYNKRLAQLETIIRDHDLVTVPARPARIRIGTPAENAAIPAPNMVAPRLIGNTGEQGEFVIPLGLSGGSERKYDDFSYDAAAWTLTAHEARPGHELQYARMLEGGVSLARAIFSFNSVNVEGWALYAESISLPFMPDEGKLVSLNFQLLRAARAFLDPELQQGTWQPEAARELLMKDVVASPALATEEVDRFTFQMPGQAVSYFYGFVRMRELRDAVEKQQGAKFDQHAFHDLVLGQGLLRPDLLREAVMSALAPR